MNEWEWDEKDFDETENILYIIFFFFLLSFLSKFVYFYFTLSDGLKKISSEDNISSYISHIILITLGIHFTYLLWSYITI